MSAENSVCQSKLSVCSFFSLSKLRNSLLFWRNDWQPSERRTVTNFSMRATDSACWNYYSFISWFVLTEPAQLTNPVCQLVFLMIFGQTLHKCWCTNPMHSENMFYGIWKHDNRKYYLTLSINWSSLRTIRVDPKEEHLWNHPSKFTLNRFASCVFGWFELISGNLAICIYLSWPWWSIWFQVPENCSMEFTPFLYSDAHRYRQCNRLFYASSSFIPHKSLSQLHCIWKR